MFSAKNKGQGGRAESKEETTREQEDVEEDWVRWRGYWESLGQEKGLLTHETKGLKNDGCEH